MISNQIRKCAFSVDKRHQSVCVTKRNRVWRNGTRACLSPSTSLRLPVVLNRQAELAAVHHAADTQTQLQVFVCQPE